MSLDELASRPWPWVRRRVLRAVRKHEGETGVLVAGRFPLTRVTTYPYLSGSAGVMIAGETVGLDNVRCGPFWFSLPSGVEQTVVVMALRGPVIERRFTLDPGQLKLVHVEPLKRDGTPTKCEIVDVGSLPQ